MITVYSSSTCPKCKVLKMKLDKAGIEYQVNENIEEMTAMGIKTIPMMQVDDQLLDFGEAIKYVKATEGTAAQQ